MRAIDIADHLRQAGVWVNRQGSVDGFKYGDPQTEVRGIAVAWQSLQSALEQAHRQGCNLFITHEPTFYAHRDDDEVLLQSEPAQRKRAFLDRTGMVVYRCHDVWDRFPRLGIVDAWSAFLELGEPIARAPYYNLHAVPHTTAWELARRIGRRVATLGEQAVQFVGTKWKMVHCLAVGTGAITDVRRMIELGADVVLTTDDGIRYWRDGAFAADLGVPVIVVNHMTAEIPGMHRLVTYLREQYPQLPCEFVGPSCVYEISAVELNRDRGVRMRRERLDDLPPVQLAEGYTWRPMCVGEEWAYIQVMNRSNFNGECDAAWFGRAFADDPAYDPSYLQIIWHGETPVAAAGAWHKEVEGEAWGLIHWVGVDSSERGSGLGKAVTLAALHRLRERGFARAFLNTADWRLPAVATYLRLGFEPWPHEAAPQSLWDQVLADLAIWRQGRRSA